jgi:hypothetical protein
MSLRRLVVCVLLARAAVPVFGAAVHLLREGRAGCKTHARAQQRSDDSTFLHEHLLYVPEILPIKKVVRIGRCRTNR